MFLCVPLIHQDEDDVPPEKRLTVEYQELIRLKRLRRKKFAGQGSNEHAGYKVMVTTISYTIIFTESY